MTRNIATMEIDSDFPALLRRTRAKANLEQKELARALHLRNASSISHMERGTRPADEARAIDLANAFKLEEAERDSFIESARAYRKEFEEARAAPKRASQGRGSKRPPVRTGPAASVAIPFAPVKPEGSLRIDPEGAAEQLQAVASELPPYISPRLRNASVQRLAERYAQSPFAESIAKMRGEQLHRSGGEMKVTYPVVVFPAEGKQTLDSVLPPEHVDARRCSAAGPTDMAICDPFPRLLRWRAAHPDQNFSDALRATSRGWNLCMTSLKRGPSGELLMQARLAEYGLVLDTCDALIDETFLGDIDAPWPLRDAIEAKENPFESGLHRAAGVGIAALITVVEREASGAHVLNALVGMRSRSVGTYPETWHVAPAGMFNWRFGGRHPNGSDSFPFGSYDSGDILRSVLTEYAEEAHNLNDLEDNTNRAFLEDVAVIRDLRQVAQIEFTGIAIDLANMRPEICVLIYVSDEAWHDRQDFSLNYEYAPHSRPVGHDRLPGEKRKLTSITVSRNGQPLDDALEILTPEQTVASGAAAFWLGVDRAREIFADSLSRKAHSRG